MRKSFIRFRWISSSWLFTARHALPSAPLAAKCRNGWLSKASLRWLPSENLKFDVEKLSKMFLFFFLATKNEP